MLQNLGKDILNEINEYCDQDSLINLSQTGRYFNIILRGKIEREREREREKWVLICEEVFNENEYQVIPLFAKNCEEIKKKLVKEISCLKSFFVNFLEHTEYEIFETPKHRHEKTRDAMINRLKMYKMLDPNKTYHADRRETTEILNNENFWSDKVIKILADVLYEGIQDNVALCFSIQLSKDKVGWYTSTLIFTRMGKK